MIRSASLLGAFVVWAFAVLGAIGVAFWFTRSVSTPDAFRLVLAVAIVAFFGAFVPFLRLESKI